LNKDPVIAPPKPDSKNSVTHFVDPELKMFRAVPFPPSYDGISMYDFSPEQRCKKTLNGTENNEKWHGKN